MTKASAPIYCMWVVSHFFPKDKEHDYRVASLDIVLCPACMHLPARNNLVIGVEFLEPISKM